MRREGGAPPVAAALNADGDDLADAVRSIEESLGLTFEVEAYLDCETVGDLLSRVDLAKGDRCATAMAFHRLRQTIVAMDGSARITPRTLLSEVSAESPRALEKRRAQRAGLTFGDLFSGWRSSLALVAGVVAVFALPVALLLASWALAVGGVFVAAATVLLARSDPGAFPRGLTVNALARAVAEVNLGRLAALGARIDAELLGACLRRELAGCAGLRPERLDRHTLLLSNARRGARDDG